MAVNALTYVKNVGKSFGYSSIEALKSYNPQIVALAEGAKEMTESLYDTIDSFKAKMYGTDDEKGFLGKGKDYVSEIRNNLFEDLKSGNWYNKQRANKQEEDLAMKMFGIDEEDFNLDDLDFDFDDSDDFNLDDLDSTEAIIESEKQNTNSIINAMDAVAGKASCAVAEANVKSADYIVSSQRQSSKALYSLNSRGFEQMSAGFAALNGNIQQLVTLGEPLTAHMQNSATFFTESSEFHKNMLTKIDKLIELNTIKTDDRYNSNVKGLNYLLNDGVVDLGAYFDFLHTNIKESIEDITGMLDMIGGMDGLVKMISGSPMKFAVDGITKVLFPKMIKNTMQSFNNHLEGFFAAAIDKLQYGDHKGTLNDIISAFGDKLFPSDRYKEKADVSNYNKGKTFWDGKSKKALEEVIPTYLATIASAVTGAPETRFNYNTGKYETLAGIKRAHQETKERYAKNAGGDFRSDSLKLVDNLDLSAEAKKKLKEEIEDFFLKSFEKGKSKMTEINKDSFNAAEFGLTHDSLAILRAMLGSYARTGKTDKSNRFAGEVRLQRERYGDYIRGLESSNGDSTLSLFNNSDIISKGLKPTKGNSKVEKEDLLRPGGILGIDKYNHDIFYYLQGIFKHTKHVSDNLGSIGGGTGIPARNRTSSGIILPGRTNSSSGFVPIAEIEMGTTNQTDQEASNNNSTSVSMFNSTGGIIASQAQLDEWTIKNHEWEDGGGVFNNKKRQEKNRKAREERIEAKRRDYALGNISEDELNEFITNEDKQAEREHKSNESTNKLLSRFTDIAGDSDAGKGIRSVYGKIQDIMNKPAEVVAEILGAGEISLYHLIYGSEGDDEKGLFAYFYSKADKLFDKFQNFMESKWWNSAKDWMKNNLTDSSGESFWDATRRELKAAWKHEADSATRFLGLESPTAPDKNEGAGETEQASSNTVQEALQQVANSVQNNAFGNRRSKRGLAAVSKGELIIPANKNPFFFGNFAEGGTVDDRQRMYEELFDQDEIYTEDGLADEKKIKRGNRNYAIRHTGDGLVNFVRGSFAQLVNDTQDAFHRILPQDQDKENNIIDKVLSEENAKRLREANVPKEAVKNKGALGAGAIIGAGTSVLTGCIVGPFAGAAIGAGVGLIVRSEKVQKALFGDVGEDGKRSGGIIGKKASNFISEKLPTIARMGGLGALAGMFMGSPVVGTIMGSAIGFATQSDKFKNYLFGNIGEDGKRSGGLMSKKVQETIKQRLPKIGAGAIAGLVFGPFGSIPANLIIGGSLGFLTSTETFKKALLGDPDSNDPDKKNGILGGIKQYLFGKVDDKNKKQGLLVSITGIFEKLAIDIKTRTKDLFFSMSKRIRHMLAKAVHSTIGQKIANSKLVKGAKSLAGAAIGTVMAPIKGLRWGAQKIDENLGRRALEQGEGLYNRDEHRMMTAQERLAERTRLGMDRHASRTLRGRSNRNFDEFLANKVQSQEQLDKIKQALTYYNDPTKAFDDQEIQAKKDFAKQLEEMGVDPAQALKLEKALAGKGFRTFDEVLGGIDNLSDEQRESLQSQFTNIKNIRRDREDAKGDREYARRLLRGKSEGIFKALDGIDIGGSSGADIRRMLELIKAEENGRFNKTEEEKKQEQAENRDVQNADNIDKIHNLLDEIVAMMKGEAPSANNEQQTESAEAIREAAEAITESANTIRNTSSDTQEDQLSDDGFFIGRAIRNAGRRVANTAINADNALRNARVNISATGGNVLRDTARGVEFLNGRVVNPAVRGAVRFGANRVEDAGNIARSIGRGTVNLYHRIDNALENRYRGNSAAGEGSTEPITDNGNAALGRKVTKTGVVAVSEGELIIPSDFNPFYHGTNDKRVQLSNENKAVDKFFGNYALGGTILSGLSKAGSGLKKAGGAIKSGASTFYQKTEGIRGILGEGLHDVADKAKSIGENIRDRFGNKDSDDENSSNNEAANIVRNTRTEADHLRLDMGASGGAGGNDSGLADNRSDVVTQTDAFGNVYQLRRNRQGELTMDETDSQTQAAMRSQRSIKDSLMGIPLIGDKIDQLREAIMGDGKPTKKRGKTVMDLLKGLASGLLGKGGLLGGIFSFLTSTKLGTKVGAALAASKEGLKGILKVGLLGGTTYLATSGALDGIASTVVNIIRGETDNQYGDSRRDTIDGQVLAKDENGELIKNENGEFQTESGEYVSGNINVVGEDNSLSHNLKKNAMRGFVSGHSSVVAKAAAKSINNAKRVITGQKGTLKGKDLSGKGLANTTAKAATGFLNMIESSLRNILGKLPDILPKLPFVGKYFSDPAKVKNMCDELFSLIYHKLKSGKKLIAKFASGFAKCLAILNIVQIITAATNAWGDAEAILGVSDPTVGQRIIAVLVATINTMIPFIGDLIPNDVLVDIFVKLAPMIGIDLSGFEQQRAEANKELAEYNEANGTDLDWDEYLMEQGRRGWWSKTKHKFNNIKENIKQKGLGKSIKDGIGGIKKKATEKFTKFKEDLSNKGLTDTIDDTISSMLPGPIGDIYGNASRIWTNAIKGDMKAIRDVKLIETKEGEKNAMASIMNGIGNVIKIPAFPVAALSMGAQAIAKPITKLIDGVKNGIAFLNKANQDSDTLYNALSSGNLDWKAYIGSVNNYKDPDGNPVGFFAKGIACITRLIQFPKYMLKGVGIKIAEQARKMVDGTINSAKKLGSSYANIFKLAFQGKPIDMLKFSSGSLNEEGDSYSPINGIIDVITWIPKPILAIPSSMIWIGKLIAEKTKPMRDATVSTVKMAYGTWFDLYKLMAKGDLNGMLTHSSKERLEEGQEASPINGLIDVAMVVTKGILFVPTFLSWAGHKAFDGIKKKFGAIKDDFAITKKSMAESAKVGATEGAIKMLTKELELNKDDPIRFVFHIMDGIAKAVFLVVGLFDGIKDKLNKAKEKLGDGLKAVRKFFGFGDDKVKEADEKIQNAVVEHSKKYSTKEVTDEQIQEALNGNVDYGGNSGLMKKTRNLLPRPHFFGSNDYSGAGSNIDNDRFMIGTKPMPDTITANNSIARRANKIVGGSSGMRPSRARRYVGGDSNILTDTVDVLSTIQDVLRNILYKIPKILRKIPYIGSRYFSDTENITKGVDKLYGIIYHKIKNTKKLLKGLAEKFSKCFAIFNIISVICTATNAWGDAESILGISEPTNQERLIAVLVAVLGDLIPFIGDFFSSKELVDIFVEIAPYMNIDLSDFKIQREQAEKELEEYNKENGTDLDWDEYLSTMGKGGWLTKTENKVKSAIGGSSGIFVSQMDEKYRNIPFGGSNVGDVGCAPAAATMLMNYEKPGSMTMDKAIRAAKNYQQPEGTSADYFGSVLKQNGLESNYIDGSTKRGKQSIVDDLASGKPAVLLGQDAMNSSKSASPFGPNKHFVMATGFDEYGNVIVNDPESNTPDRVYNPSILNKVDMAVTSSQMDIDENTDAILENTKLVGGGSSVPDNEITRAVYGFFTKNGYSPATTAGIMANAMHESGVNPSVIQNNGKGPAAGMFQWENWRDKSARWLALNNYAASKGKDWTDLQSQLEFAKMELEDPYMNHLFKKDMKTTNEPYMAKALPNGVDDFKNLDDPLNAALQFEAKFERGGTPRMERRFGFAKDFYNLYSGSEYTGQFDGSVGSVTGGTEIDTTKENIVEDGTKPLGEGEANGNNTSSGIPDILGSIGSAFQKGFQLAFGGGESEQSQEKGGTGGTFGTSSSGSVYGNNSSSGSVSGDGKGTAQSFIDIARSQLGTEEVPENITPYGKFMGMDGQPWCASFVSWVMDQTFNGNKEIRNKALRGNPSASVQGLWSNFKGANAMYKDPQPGDIVIYKNNGASHTGLVESVNDGNVQTIEGNTSGDNGYNRNGGMVARKKFKVGQNSRVTGYGRPDWDTASEMFKKLERQENLEKGANAISGAVSSIKLGVQDPDKLGNTISAANAAKDAVSSVKRSNTISNTGNSISNIASTVKSTVGGGSGLNNRETINPTMIRKSVGAGTSNSSGNVSSSNNSQLIDLVKGLTKLLEAIVTNTSGIGNIDNTLTEYCGASIASDVKDTVSNTVNINAAQNGSIKSDDPALKDLMATLNKIAAG